MPLNNPLPMTSEKFENLRASMFKKILTVMEYGERLPAHNAYDGFLVAVAGGMECSKASHELTIVPGESPTVVKQDVGYGAKATGGLDDLEDIYSGRSGPGNDPFKEGGVKKRYIGGRRPSHMLFDSIADEEALCKLPRIDCPSCGIPVKGLSGGQESYPVPSGQIDLSSGSPMIEQIPVLSYTLAPCGCRVNQEWAAAFTVELNNRKAGKKAQAVIDMSGESRTKKQKSLLDQLAKLYAARDKAETPQEKQGLEYNLVIVTDQLMRLMPGAHNQVKPVTFSSEVQKWAEKHKMKLPVSLEDPEPHGLPPKKLNGVDPATGEPWTSLMMGTWVPGAPSTSDTPKTVGGMCNLGSLVSKNPCAEIPLGPTPYQNYMPADKIAQVQAAAEKIKKLQAAEVKLETAAILAGLNDADRKELLSVCAELNITPQEALAKSKQHAAIKKFAAAKTPPTGAEGLMVTLKNLPEGILSKAQMSPDMLAFLFPGQVPETRTLPQSPPTQPDPAKVAEVAVKVGEKLDSYDKIRAQVMFLLPLLKKNHAYLAQLTRCCVVPGKTFSEAEEAVDAIGKNLQDFLDMKAPLSEHSSILLTSFLANSDLQAIKIVGAPDSKYPQYVDGTAGVTPVAAPVSESLKEAMQAEVHKKVLDAQKEKVREAFHKKLERLPRKITKLKKADD